MLTLLLRYRSWDVFSLGSQWLPTSHTISEVRYPGRGPSPLRPTPTGLTPSTAHPSEATSAQPSGRATGPNNPTSPHSYPWGFGLGSSPFTRRYSGNPGLVSSPPPTWMLPFGGFPIPGRSPGTRWLPTAGCPIRGSPVLSLPAATRGLSQLATPFFGAQAEASTGWRTPA